MTLQNLSQYGIGFQVKVLSSLLTHKEFLLNIQDVLSEEYFDNTAHRWIIKEILKYYQKYHTTPSMDVLKVELKKILNASEISFFQQLVRNIPIADNVLEYAVSIAAKTRPGTTTATDEVNKFLSWGAGPRASQFLVLGAKCHAAISGKYSPDQEDVRAVAESILRHRIVRNYKAEAEGLSTEMIISNLL